ncbi:SRPBCC family protein [Tahibacter caeni]|uniref:SRPBCC family protein n=1 Tax=Tahibacter caeni TaxID=1453545 RepID=UPI00214821F2|nr:SRPBCC family protein [Tahibacter caeni]
MHRSGTLQISLPSDTEILMTRVFDAPRRLVFAALTQPDLLRRWFGGPPGWRLDVCELDARVGGKYRYVWVGSNGEVMGMGGTILEFVAPERMVADEHYDQAWYEGQGVSSIVLTEQAGQTTLRLTVRYDSKAVRDHVLSFPATTGVEMGYDRLADWLAGAEAEAALARLD